VNFFPSEVKSFEEHFRSVTVFQMYLYTGSVFLMEFEVNVILFLVT
jgi:hypothetical protein